MVCSRPISRNGDVKKQLRVFAQLIPSDWDKIARFRASSPRDREQDRLLSLSLPMGIHRGKYLRLADRAGLSHNMAPMSATTTPDFEGLVEQYYRSLYSFAQSLTGVEAEACDLTQQTFYIWARKGHQLRDTSKVKTWLFTTLHREFLRTKRRSRRFPHQELNETEQELPLVEPVMVNQLDAEDVVAALGQVNELYRSALTLFYLEDLSYREIAETLDVPIGTVQSRLARGKAELQQLLHCKEIRG